MQDDQSTTPTQARQGKSGQPVFLVLAAGLTLACIAGLILFFGGV
jgi:hypothetical protein